MAVVIRMILLFSIIHSGCEMQNQKKTSRSAFISTRVADATSAPDQPEEEEEEMEVA